MRETSERHLYVILLSLHGLIRGRDLELGRDADTGGQVLYVVELARALSEHPEVRRVDLITRQVSDSKVSADYARSEERIADRARIIRLPFGPRRYLRKEVLWPWIDSCVDAAIQHIRNVGLVPDFLHAHYADAGLAGAKLASLLGVPLVFTAHSLGYEKRRRLREQGMNDQTIESRYNMSQRIEAEETALASASMVIASTRQEASDQYASYDNYRKKRVTVIPPGVDLHRFRPPKHDDPVAPIKAEVERFLREPRLPWVLAMSRPDERKNLRTLIDAYAQNRHLKAMANLVVVAGTRDDIAHMERGPRRVLTDMLLRIDRHDLYGRVAYPKYHESEDVPDLYRLAARSRGVFVNPALTEPFGLTLIEAAASGLPVVATHDGGPRDIIGQCKNGLLIDPLDAERMGEALAHAIGDRRRWRRWAKRGVSEAHRHYSWPSHVEKYLAAVHRVARRRVSRGTPRVKTRLPTVDRLLVCDIDDTLLGDDEALRLLVERLREADHHTGFGIATGRRLASAVEALEESGVPIPEFLITAVGTEIYYGPSLMEEAGWAEHINYRWNAQAVRDALEGIPGLTLQPATEQRPYKVSYYVDAEHAPGLREIRSILRRHGLQANIIYSHDRNLDLLPLRASKGLAVRYLAYRWGVPIERVLVAGDSGNDEEMLSGNSLGVVVGNYSRELERLRGRDRIYFAHAHYARGILEGIEHYDFFGEIRDQQ